MPSGETFDQNILHCSLRTVVHRAPYSDDASEEHRDKGTQRDRREFRYQGCDGCETEHCWRPYGVTGYEVQRTPPSALWPLSPGSACWPSIAHAAQVVVHILYSPRYSMKSPPLPPNRYFSNCESQIRGCPIAGRTLETRMGPSTASVEHSPWPSVIPGALQTADAAVTVLSFTALRRNDSCRHSFRAGWHVRRSLGARRESPAHPLSRTASMSRKGNGMIGSWLGWPAEPLISSSVRIMGILTERAV